MEPQDMDNRRRSKGCHAWRLWAKALGEKAGRNEKEADIIAFVRTIIIISYMTTNAFIVAGVVRHWDDAPSRTRNHMERFEQ